MKMTIYSSTNKKQAVHCYLILSTSIKVCAWLIDLGFNPDSYLGHTSAKT